MPREEVAAFPEERGCDNVGMDLRDYFAAKALSLIPFLAKEVFQNPGTWSEEEIADEAYRIADEMMKRRDE